MSAQKFADNPTVRHPTPTTKLSASARVAAAESRAENKKQRSTHSHKRKKSRSSGWSIFCEGSSMKIRLISGIPAVLRIHMVCSRSRWRSINRSVSGKLNWQLVANKQCYEYVWYVLEGVSVQVDHSWRVEEQRGSMGINPGKAANSGQLWLFFSIFLSWVEQATRPNSIGNQGQLEEKSQMAVFFLVFL